MQPSFAERLSNAWYSGAKWPYLFVPLSLLFLFILALRALFRTSPPPSQVPVIVVGNITAGGTGKSPLVSYLARYFEGRGLRVGVVSRGYGVSIPKHEVREVGSDSSAAEVGDEPLMLKRLLGCDIALCPQRSLAVDFLQKKGVDIIVADDGLQHYAMHRDIELCVVDGARGFGNRRLLPVGPLRESVSRANQVDAIVVNGELASGVTLPSNVYATQMQLVPKAFVSLNDECEMSIEAFVEQYSDSKINAIAAIGNPQRFFDTLAGMGLSISSQPYPDHYAYQQSDFSGITECLVMTEKDAAKCKALELENAWFLRVEPELQDKLGDKLYNRLKQLKRL